MNRLFLATLIGLTASAYAQTSNVDVFLLSGQSNADGSNSYYQSSGNPPSKGPGLTPANAHFANAYSGVKYAYAHANPASSPNPRYLQSSGFQDLKPATWGMMGPEISLGRNLDALHTDDVALLKYTSPGTSLNTQWGPDDNLLYPDMVNFYSGHLATLATQYTTVTVHTFFWHQGESDSGTTYVADYATMFDQLKIDLNLAGLTSVMGMLHEDFLSGTPGNPQSNIGAVNNAITQLSMRSDIANTGSLNAIPLHDQIHWDANGQLTHGDKMYDAYRANFYQVPEPSSSILLLMSSSILLSRRKRL